MIKIEDCLSYKMKYINKYETHIDTCFNYTDCSKRMIQLYDSPLLKEKKINTLNYLMNNYEAGAIYIEIKNGKIKDYFAIVNLNFENKWHDYIPNGNYFEYNKQKEKILKTRVFEKGAKLMNKKLWTKNGFLINMFDYGRIFNSYQLELIDLIKETVNNKKIADVCFIIWTKDIPLLNYTGSDPYIPKYKINIKKNYLPILSQSTNFNLYLDIPIPNSEEWAICRKLYIPEKKPNKPLECKQYINIDLIKKYKWADKIEKGFFRGRSTGYYNDLKNPRLKVAFLGKNNPDYLDTGITNFVRRDKIIGNKISYIVPQDLGLTIIDFISNCEFGKYKYLINIEGNGLPYRKPSLFFYKSVILDVQSNFKAWFETAADLFKPYVHYIPIKRDLSDLIEKIQWCKNNDKECKKIAKNCYKFAIENFNYNNYINYMEKILLNAATGEI